MSNESEFIDLVIEPLRRLNSGFTEEQLKQVRDSVEFMLEKRDELMLPSVIQLAMARGLDDYASALEVEFPNAKMMVSYMRERASQIRDADTQKIMRDGKAH